MRKMTLQFVRFTTLSLSMLVAAASFANQASRNISDTYPAYSIAMAAVHAGA